MRIVVIFIYLSCCSVLGFFVCLFGVVTHVPLLVSKSIKAMPEMGTYGFDEPLLCHIEYRACMCIFTIEYFTTEIRRKTISSMRVYKHLNSYAEKWLNVERAVSVCVCNMVVLYMEIRIRCINQSYY